MKIRCWSILYKNLYLPIRSLHVSSNHCIFLTGRCVWKGSRAIFFINHTNLTARSGWLLRNFATVLWMMIWYIFYKSSSEINSDSSLPNISLYDCLSWSPGNTSSYKHQSIPSQLRPRRSPKVILSPNLFTIDTGTSVTTTAGISLYIEK